MLNLEMIRERVKLHEAHKGRGTATNHGPVFEDRAALLAAIDRVIAACDQADRHQPGDGHWISTTEIRSAVERR